MAFLPQRRSANRRVLVFIGFILACFLFLAIRLFVLQIINNQHYQEIVIDQLTRETVTTASRGKIFDTNGNLLVTNTTVYRVFISPKAIEEFEKDADNKYTSGQAASEIATKLSEVLGVDYNTVMEKSKKTNRQDETIKKNVDPETAQVLREFIKEKGFATLLNLSAESKRYYCYGNLASHLIGFTNSDGDGVYGIEATYNSYLKGTSGKYVAARNALNGPMPFAYEAYVGGENGSNVVSTIDIRLQHELENQLYAAYESALPTNRVCGLVIDVNTGGILAGAVYPNYDCNDPYTLVGEFLEELDSAEYPVESEEYSKLRSSLMYKMWNNKLVNEPYEPGSTFKIITSAIALEEGVVNIDDKFYCSGHYFVEGYSTPIACHKKGGHGMVTFARGLQQSCNPLMMNTIEKIGLETFYKYFEALGYTTRTGVDLTGEAYGSYHEMKAMHSVELAVYSFGQTFKATPLQQLTAICTVANGGYVVTPHVMKEIVDEDGNIVKSFENVEKVQIFSKETCDTIINILAEGVATDGGARNAYTKGYSVAAKTGTSQKQDKYVYYDAEGNVVSYTDEWVTSERPYRIGSTVAFAPADDPQIAVIIIVDEPSQGGSYGSIVAAPYISNFLSVALPYLGYEPHYTDAELASMDVGIGNLVGFTAEDATLYITNRKLKFKIIGEGRVVTAQVPASGSRLPTNGGTVYLYMGDAEPEENIIVPDVIGQTAKAANKLIVNSNLNIMIQGSANSNAGNGPVAISQSPAAGTAVPAGSIVTVEFRYMDGTD